MISLVLYKELKTKIQLQIRFTEILFFVVENNGVSYLAGKAKKDPVKPSVSNSARSIHSLSSAEYQFI